MGKPDPGSSAWTTVDVIATLAHELRAPLTSVRGYVRTLLRRWDAFDDDLRKEMLEAVIVDAERVGRMIDELLDLSRIESGRFELNRIDTDLASIIERVVSRHADTPDHTVTANVVPARLEVDSDKVEQIVTNLVANAVRHTPSGEVVVGLEADGTITVSDSGPGMTPEQVAGIFDPFVRRSKSPEGTGLGLHLAKQFAIAHGGTITVQTSPDSGSTFTVKLQ